MTADDELTLTVRRRTALSAVDDGKVTYNGLAGTWMIDGEPVTGWQGRTLSELHRAHYIKREVREQAFAVVITDAGQVQLRSEVDTPDLPG